MLVSTFSGMEVMAAETQPMAADCNITCEFDSDFSLVYYYKINSTGNFTKPYLNVVFFKYTDSGDRYSRQTVNVTDYTYDSSSKTYRFVFSGISAAEMGNTVQARLCAYIGEQVYASDYTTYSVKQYAEDVLNAKMSSKKTEDKKLCTLMVDMLNYGTAAQVYFGRHVRVLANSGLTSEQNAVGSTVVSSAATCLSKTAFDDAKATLQKMALTFDNSINPVGYASFETKPASTVYAELSYKDIDGQTRKSQVYSKDFEYDKAADLYRMEFGGISPLYFKTPFKIVFKDGSKAISATTTYSVESYAHDILAGDFGGQIKDLVKKMLTYGGSARAFYDAYNSSEQPVIDDGISTYKNSKYTKDMPKAVIVIPSSASKEEQFAAQMIQYYINKENNYEPSIVKDGEVSQGSRGFEISVGNTNRPHGTAKYSSDGSYKIYSYNNGISIKGVGKRGTIDGTGKFLALCGGYYWLSFEDGYRTNQTKFKYETDINYDYQRPFLFTDIDACYGSKTTNDYCMFDVASGLNGHFSLMDMNVAYEGWYLYSKGNTAKYNPGQVHTMLTEYFHSSDYDAHKNWFARINVAKPGETPRYERRFVQPCLSNPDVYKHIEDQVFKILENKNGYSNYNKNAPMQIISLCQEDNSYVCTCDNCKALRLQYQGKDVKGNYDASYETCLYLDLCNKISAAVKKAGYKNVYIDMLAYTTTLRPPEGLTVDDHVIIRYAPINRCYAHNCDDTTCQRNKDYSFYLKTWLSLTKNSGQVWIWDYNANWYSTIMPFPNIQAMCHDIKYYKQIGVKGLYLQSNDIHTTCNAEFGDLRLYIESVLLENPNADVDKELEFFLNEFYGAGAPYIKEYLEIMTTQAKRHFCGPNTSEAIKWQFRLFCLKYDIKPKEQFCNSYIDYDGTDYTSAMQANNRMPDSDINRCEELYNAAMKAVANNERHKFTTGRTLVSWKLVKSVLKVKEFANASTYKSQNEKLYKELVNTYKVTVFSLIWRTRTDQKLDMNPGEWVVK